MSINNQQSTNNQTNSESRERGTQHTSLLTAACRCARAYTTHTMNKTKQQPQKQQTQNPKPKSNKSDTNRKKTNLAEFALLLGLLLRGQRQLGGRFHRFLHFLRLQRQRINAAMKQTQTNTNNQQTQILRRNNNNLTNNMCIRLSELGLLALGSFQLVNQLGALQIQLNNNQQHNQTTKQQSRIIN